MRNVAAVVCVALVALAVGVGMAGLPERVEDDVAASEIRPAESTTSAVATTASPNGSQPPRSVASAGSTPASGSVASVGGSTSASPGADQQAADVRVIVANASRSSGAASRLGEQVRQLGYQVVVADASEGRATTVIYFAPDHERAGRALADQLAITDVQPRPPGQLTLADDQGSVWVLVGEDLA